MDSTGSGVALTARTETPSPDRMAILRDRLGVAVILAGVSLNMLLLSAISPVLSTIAAHFGGGGGAALMAQSIITFSGVGIMVGGPLAGWLGDRIGLPRLLFLALAVYGVTGSAGLYLDDKAALLASRLVQGMASAGIAASTFAMIGNRFDGATRARLLGYQGSFVAAAGSATLLIAGAVAKAGGWRTPFSLYLLAFALLAVALAATYRTGAEPAALAAAGPRRSSRALLAMWPTYLMIVPLYVGAYMFFLQLSFVLAGDGVTSPVIQSRVMTAITVMNFVGGLFYGRILERIGPKWMFVLILAAMAVSNLMVGFSQGIWATVVACGLAGLGGGSLVPYITNLVLGQAPADMRGRAVGFQYMAMYLGDFMNPLIVTPMRLAIGKHQAFAVIGGLLALGAAAQALARRPVGIP